MSEKIKLGISACLLGQSVRYDGGHKGEPFLMDVLSEMVDYVPICPEVELSMGIPREPLHLMGTPDAPRLLTRDTALDFTDRMLAWANKRLDELEKEQLCGFIFKSKSPSCGIVGLRINGNSGVIRNDGVGIFACALMKRFPLLPVAEEIQLRDIAFKENFIHHVWAYFENRWVK